MKTETPVMKDKIARCKWELLLGKVHTYDILFDFEIEDSTIRYMVEEGNYSCDCNKSAFLIESGLGIEEYPCGEEIELIGYEIIKD